MTKVMTGFRPEIHGFHFGNAFVNEVFNLGLFGVSLASWRTKGRCGGMAFASLDYYRANLPIPSHAPADFPDQKVPAEGSRLARYIYIRQRDSLWANARKFVEYTQALDHDTWLYGMGITKRTKDRQFPYLLEKLKDGPAALGLIKAERVADIGRNHQVVAYGAETDEATGSMTIYIYDSNFPDHGMTLRSDPSNPRFVWGTSPPGSPDDVCRGFFVEEYSPRTPSYVDLAVVGPLLAPPCAFPGDPVDCEFTVKNFGDYPASMKALMTMVQNPAGDPLGTLFPRDVVDSIGVGEQRTCRGHCNRFDTIPGKHVLSPVYISGMDRPISLPVAIRNEIPSPMTVFMSKSEAIVDVRRNP